MANVKWDGDLPNNLNKEREPKKGRSNKEIVKEINEPNKPDAGARQMTGKNSQDCDDSLGAAPKSKQVKQTKFDASESTEQTQRKSVDRQIGDSAIPVDRKDRQKGNPKNVDEN
jgi:hypothetical protein